MTQEQLQLIRRMKWCVLFAVSRLNFTAIYVIFIIAVFNI